MDACFWGETVGELVIIVQNLRREIGAEASLNKSIRVVRHRLESTDRSGRNIYSRSESAIKSHWKRLKPVAHLWAAYVTTLPPRKPPGASGLHQVHFGADLDFRAFLYLAERFADAGGQHFSKRQGSQPIPLIEPNLALRAPKDLDLSMPSEYLVGLQPLTPEEIQVALAPQK